MSSTVRFTEEMKGHIALGETDPDIGREVAVDRNADFMFHLTIETIDMKRFVEEPEHQGHAGGWITAAELGSELPVERGVFNLFVDTDDPGTKHMKYRLWFHDQVGNPLTFTGTKVVHDDPGFDVWSDTSTLYCHLRTGHVEEVDDEGTEVVGAGVLRILKRDFAKQLTTFRTRGGSLGDRFQAFAAFGRLFTSRLVDVFVKRHDEPGGPDDDG